MADDQELIQRLAVRVDDAFENVVLAYQHQLYAFALRLTGSARDAEEIAQDALVRAYNALCRYDGARIRELRLRPWLYQITMNVYRNRYRAAKVLETPLEAESGERIHEPAADERTDPAALLLQAELNHCLARALSSLPPRYRPAVVLRHVMGLDYGELVEALGQPLGTVKSNVHRGIKLMREALKEGPYANV